MNQLAPNVGCCTAELTEACSPYCGDSRVVLGAMVRWKGMLLFWAARKLWESVGTEDGSSPVNSRYQTSGAEAAQYLACGHSFLHSDKTLSVRRPCSLHFR